MGWRDRLQTIAVTATVTSIAWVMAGTVLFTRQVDGPPRVRQIAPLPAAYGPVQPDPVSGLVIPVQGVTADQLTDTWGQSREGGARAHQAIDIMAPRGTPVLAAAPGTVEKLFVSVRGGNTVYVRSLDRRVIYYYAHLDQYAPGLTEKQQVRAGQLLAFVGSSGDASPEGPHLHFAINVAQPAEGWWQGTAVNPYPLLRRQVKDNPAGPRPSGRQVSEQG